MDLVRDAVRDFPFRLLDVDLILETKRSALDKDIRLVRFGVPYFRPRKDDNVTDGKRRTPVFSKPAYDVDHARTVAEFGFGHG